MSLEVEGFGTTLSYATATTYASPTVITKMIQFKPPKYTVDAIPTSTFTTTAQTETSQGGWIKPGKAECTILFDHTLINTLDGLKGTLKGWIVTYADGSTRKFDGFIVGFGEEVPMEKLVTYQFEIQASGPTTWTAGS